MAPLPAVHAAHLSTGPLAVLCLVSLLAAARAGGAVTRLVALLAALALVLSGAQAEEALTNTLGEQIVWLLLAAFVIAAVIKEAGLAERLVAPLTARAPRVLPFFLMTGAAISLTAFLLPSTSGRAALLLPVYLGLLAALPDQRLAKPLALLFPSAILLSAGGSLIGAGAHVVAVEAIDATGGPRIGYLDWFLIGAPLAAFLDTPHAGGIDIVLGEEALIALALAQDLAVMVELCIEIKFDRIHCSTLPSR